MTTTLVDTDVLIWVLRGHNRARALLETTDALAVSAVTEMELIQGARDKRDLGGIRMAFADLRIAVVPLSERISRGATDLLAAYALSHGLRMADALIAATALVNEASLLTANRRHFAFVPGLAVAAFRP